MLSKADALALLADNTFGWISAADMRQIVSAIYDDGIDNVAAIGHRVDYMEQVNEAVMGAVLPWDGTGTYTPGDVVMSDGGVFLCLKAQAANHPKPKPGADWAQLDYVGQYGTLLDLEMRVHALEAKP